MNTNLIKWRGSLWEVGYNWDDYGMDGIESIIIFVDFVVLILDPEDHDNQVNMTDYLNEKAFKEIEKILLEKRG